VPRPDDPRLPIRLPELASRDRTLLDALLDSTRIAHVGLVAEDGTPVVIPTAAVRDGDRLLCHGSTGSRWMRRIAQGAPVSIAVTADDGLSIARSAFESSFLYRSAVLFGSCVVVDDPDDKVRALDLLTDGLLPGRVAEVRRPTKAELAATLVLALALDDWSLKINDGWPEDGPDDVVGRAWAGVLRRQVAYGAPEPAPDLAGGIEVPPSVAALSRPPAG
jgi:nitroimidazol reductase NimA-like FMN-containing flavoprotein (pyridoxamine 5'-phosphate oxidase superfamily)